MLNGCKLRGRQCLLHEGAGVGFRQIDRCTRNRRVELLEDLVSSLDRAWNKTAIGRVHRPAGRQGAQIHLSMTQPILFGIALAMASA